MRRALLLLLLAGCDARISGGTAGGTGGGTVSAVGGGAGGAGGGTSGPLTNLDVYTRLRPTCGGCHELTERPYFASLATFENSLAYDPRWVVPGSPQTSELIKLLNATRAVRMPPAPQSPFAVMAANGMTHISMADIEEWIRTLTPRMTVPPLDVAVVRRKSAEQVIASLFDQLGLAEGDFYTAGLTPKANDTYAVRSPDGTPYADPFDQGGTLFMSMGGPWRLEGKLRNDAPSQGFVQALTHVSQAWCRTAFAKPGNTAVLSKATLADTTATAGGTANIRANLADLYLRMLGQDATPAELDDLVDTVFKPYESKGALTAWTAVCASLVRDPLWMVY